MRRVRSFEDVVEQVRASIADGSIEAGERLPSERELAEQFGVSRSTLREALRALEAVGVLEIRLGAQGGAFATEPTARLVGTMQELLKIEAARRPADTATFRAGMHADNARWAVVTDASLAELAASVSVSSSSFLITLAQLTALPLRVILAQALEAAGPARAKRAELSRRHMLELIDLLGAFERDRACERLFSLLAGDTATERPSE